MERIAYLSKLVKSRVVYWIIVGISNAVRASRGEERGKNKLMTMDANWTHGVNSIF